MMSTHDEDLRACVAREPDATLAEHQAWLIAKHETKVSIGCLWKRPVSRALPCRHMKLSAIEIARTSGPRIVKSRVRRQLQQPGLREWSCRQIENNLRASEDGQGANGASPDPKAHAPPDGASVLRVCHATALRPPTKRCDRRPCSGSGSDRADRSQ
jgi:hypothetical protein